MAINYPAAWQILRNPSSRGIAELELMLEQDGFSKKIDPLGIDGARWYLNNLANTDEDKTDNLTPYARGFVRQRPDGLVAAYAIQTSDDIVSKIRLPKGTITSSPVMTPRHYFFIQGFQEELKRRHLTESLTDAPSTLRTKDLAHALTNVAAITLTNTLLLKAHSVLTGQDLADMTPGHTVFLLGASTFYGLATLEFLRDVRDVFYFETEEHPNCVPACSSWKKPSYGLRGIRKYNADNK